MIRKCSVPAVDFAFSNQARRIRQCVLPELSCLCWNVDPFVTAQGIRSNLSGADVLVDQQILDIKSIKPQDEMTCMHTMPSTDSGV